MPLEQTDNHADARDKLLAELRLRMVRDQIERPVKGDRTPVRHPGVLAAMREIPRHEFITIRDPRAAYEDRPIPIGESQTISQPYMVAVMTELLNPGPTDVILEVGTGSGYQAAVLSKLARDVFTVEADGDLAGEAERRLKRLGFANVRVRCADGAKGWREHCPFDGIMVTAAGPNVPPDLLEQLMPGGRLVIPIGETPEAQQLWVLEKRPDGSVERRQIMPVRFVPLV